MTTDTDFLLVLKSVNGPCFVTGQRVIDLTELVGHFVSSPRKREKNDRR